MNVTFPHEDMDCERQFARFLTGYLVEVKLIASAPTKCFVRGSVDDENGFGLAVTLPTGPRMEIDWDSIEWIKIL